MLLVVDSACSSAAAGDSELTGTVQVFFRKTTTSSFLAGGVRSLGPIPTSHVTSPLRVLVSNAYFQVSHLVCVGQIRASRNSYTVICPSKHTREFLTEYRKDVSCHVCPSDNLGCFLSVIRSTEEGRRAYDERHRPSFEQGLGRSANRGGICQHYSSADYQHGFRRCSPGMGSFSLDIDLICLI